jgi:CotS family spore coat protein
MTSSKPTSLPLTDRDGFWRMETPARMDRCRSVYKVRTGRGSYVVKPLRIGAGKAWLTGKLLSDNGECPVLPCLVPSGDGGCYWWHKGNRYLITRQISGREADYWRIGDLGAAIRTMGIFHRYTAKIVAARQPGWKLLEFEPGRIWRQASVEMEICRGLAIRAGDSWSKQYLKLWRYFSNQVFQARRAVAALPGPVVKVVCYHDWAYHNVLLDDGGGRAFLIDFDAMVIDGAAHDRANLAGRYLRLRGWTKRALLQLLRQFERLYPFRRGEFDWLRVYLTFPYDYWMLGRQYYLEKQPWSAKYFQDQWQRKIAPYQARKRILELLDEI